ncbi:GNAT family N-acetyltransferase [Streptomyces boncukensis]|uniref:GNAT family N-acetyltransferase n=1 Tax=Streptomyces boncukensis TaxID=2711219 RepID=A0A6G4WXT6_9ACTN|nr:GNAT family N-acetyltransferase [Streptomyces boncukensis]NGO69672.1 GNAT family N-acetyltransferase [Streptomyces boncukensis]
MNPHHTATISPSVLDRARAVWSRLAGAAATFTPDRTNVTVAPASRLSPPGWTAVVVLGDSALVTVPDTRTADLVSTALRGLSAGQLADTDRLHARLPYLDILGPARLLFLIPALFRPVLAPGAEQTSSDDPALLALLDRCGLGDADESALSDITSTARVVREDGEIVAAAGHELWPRGVAHLSILTDPRFRRRGLATAVASAAVTDALGQGLFPQWRARSLASRKVAHTLGFQEAGFQLSLRLTED